MHEGMNDEEAGPGHGPSLNELPDEEFWRRDLRLGAYRGILALDGDEEALRERVREAIKGKRSLRIACRAVGLDSDGRSSDLQDDLASLFPVPTLHFLSVAAFVQYKMTVAITDIAEAHLPPPALDACKRRDGKYDRLALLLQLYLAAPDTLRFVLGLNDWHRRGAAPMVLADSVPAPDQDLPSFLAPARIAPLLRSVSAGDGQGARLHYEMLVPRRDDGHLLFLRRNLKPSYQWNDTGTDLQHGHQEELIVLHVQDGAHSVRISSVTSELPLRIANHLASAYFGVECGYEDDLRGASRSAIENLIAAITDPDDDRLPIVELVLDNAPLNGSPKLMVSALPGENAIEALDGLEEAIGDSLFENLEDIARIKVQFGDNRISLFFVKEDGQWSVQYSDGRIDKNKCEEFANFMLDTFRIEVRSTEMKGRKKR